MIICMRSAAVLLVGLAITGPAAAELGDQPIRHTEMAGMTNHLALRYLTDDRYSGDAVSARGDYELLLSLHTPKNGKGPFPVVFYVHGGSWTGGSKEGQQQLAQELAGRGIAFCGFNYQLLPKGVWPQIYWDFHNAARFLRKHATRFDIDPLRFGAYGISAGGWLISIAAMPDGDHWQTGQSRAGTTGDILARRGRLAVKNPDDPYALYKPIHDPTPAWPGEAGGFSALSFDFCYCVECGDAASPAVQQWAGSGVRPKYADALIAAGGRLTISELTSAKFAGKAVHVPPFFGRGGNDEANAIDLDGKPGKSLGVVIADFFVRELISPIARPPAPEILPIPRLIAGPTPVTMLAPRGASIHFTTDGTTPTPASPVYQTALTVAPGTTVKAITVAPGMTPSGVHSAEFIAGPPPPTVTGPASLPPGETGKPYTVTFTADRPTARWQLNGDLVSYVPWQKKEMVHPNHMRFAADIGTWSGTPTTPGSYWVQVWVAEAPGMMAGYRNYRWTVTGKDLHGDAGAPVDAADRNQEFATVNGWPADQTRALLDAFASAKLRVVSPGSPGDAAVMLVVHADDRAKAVVLLKTQLATRDQALQAGVTILPGR